MPITSSLRLAVALLLVAASTPSARAQTVPAHAGANDAATLAATAKSSPPAPKHATGKSVNRRGEPVYHLLGFSLSGSKRIDPDAIVATLPQHEGDVITDADIKEDADRVRAILATRHIHGDMTSATLEQEDVKGHHIWVIYDIQLRDALSDVPLRNPRHFASQTFSGNAKLSTDQLTSITGLHAGDPMRDGKLSDVRTAIEQAYDTALPGVAVAVRGKVKLRKDDTVVINWQIDEHPGASSPERTGQAVPAPSDPPSLSKNKPLIGAAPK